MTVMFVQHPAVWIVFGLCAVCVVLAAKLSRFSLAAAAAGVLLGVAWIVLALVCSVPMAEILALLLILVLLTFLTVPKEGKE